MNPNCHMKLRPQFSIPTRPSLLYRIRNPENHASWQDFYDTYWRLVYAVARQAGLPHTEAQDVVQETFRRVAKNIAKFRYDPSVGFFKNWLLKIVGWRIKDQFRKRPKLCEPLDRNGSTGRQTPTAEQVPDPHVLEDLYEEEWKRNLLDEALKRVKSQVKPKQYQAFSLYVIKALPMKEITSLLGITPNQVSLAKLRITRLVVQEAKRLEREIL